MDYLVDAAKRPVFPEIASHGPLAVGGGSTKNDLKCTAFQQISAIINIIRLQMCGVQKKIVTKILTKEYKWPLVFMYELSDI